MLREALYTEDLGDETRMCTLCAHQCAIMPSRRGTCGIRLNRDGTIYNETYGRISVIEPVRVEEIPLYHYKPDSNLMVVGSIGCNMRCPFCSTFKYSQIGGAKTEQLSPVDLVNKFVDSGAEALFFGINEPLMNYEFVLETAIICKTQKIPIGIGTNGFIATRPLKELIPYLNFALIGLKAYDNDYVLRKCGGRLPEIKESIKHLVKSGLHIEISYLLVPDETDSDEQIDGILEWVAELKRNIPFHFLRYEPAYQYKKPQISISRVINIYEKAKKILPFVYVSNVNNHRMNQTICPSCKKELIIRKDNRCITNYINSKHCMFCGENLTIV